MTACVLDVPRDDKPARQASTGYLCTSHRDRLDQLADDIHNLTLDLELILEAGSAPREPMAKDARRPKNPYPPAPANLEALSIRDHRSSPVRLTAPQKYDGLPTDMSQPILSYAPIASWLQLVAEERPLTGRLPRTVRAQLDLLRRHHDWIAGQPWIDDYWLELFELRKALTSAVHDHKYRVYGKCYVLAGEQECAGTVLAENGSGVLRCTRNRAHAWETPQEIAYFHIASEERTG